MKNKVIGISLIVIAIGALVIAIVNILNPKEEVVINQTLSEEEIISLLKKVPFALNKSENLQEGSITEDSKVNFALNYMRIQDNYSSYVIDDEENEIATANIDKLNEVVNYIFGQDLDFNKVNYEYNNNVIYVPLEYHGGDMQVYKFKSREYNEQENFYTVYIDCLETGYSRLTALTDATIVEYNENDVLFTYVFKYREINGRRILLAYNSISNW